MLTFFFEKLPKYSTLLTQLFPLMNSSWLRDYTAVNVSCQNLPFVNTPSVGKFVKSSSTSILIKITGLDTSLKQFGTRTTNTFSFPLSANQKLESFQWILSAFSTKFVRMCANCILIYEQNFSSEARYKIGANAAYNFFCSIVTHMPLFQALLSYPF